MGTSDGARQLAVCSSLSRESYLLVMIAAKATLLQRIIAAEGSLQHDIPFRFPVRLTTNYLKTFLIKMFAVSPKSDLSLT
jgi:hypothetical protein